MRRRVVFAAMVLCGLAAVTARAAVIYDTTNLTSNGSQFVGNGTDDVGWWAQGFSTPAVNRLVTDVSMLMVTNGSSPWTFDVGIYTDSSGEPGTLVQTIYSVAGSTTPITSPFTISGLSVLLDPSTDYFVVVAPTAGQLAWNYTNGATGLSGESVNSGGSWTMGTASPQQLQVTAVVPEPSSLVLAGIGLSVAGVAVARRRSVLR